MHQAPRYVFGAKDVSRVEGNKSGAGPRVAQGRVAKVEGGMRVGGESVGPVARGGQRMRQPLHTMRRLRESSAGFHRAQAATI